MGFRRIDALDYNAIINGAYDFNQRNNGGSSSLSARQYVCQDRWAINRPSSVATAGSINATPQTDLPPGQSMGKSCRLVCNTIATTTTFHTYDQRIEGIWAQPLIGKKCVYQFWAKSNVDRNLNLSFIQNGSNSRRIGSDFVTESGLVWKKYQYAVDFGASGILDPIVDINNAVEVRFELGQIGQTTGSVNDQWVDGSTGPFFVAGKDTFMDDPTNELHFWGHVMRPVTDEQFNTVANGGEIDMDFSRAGGDYPGELMLCQRYFEKSYRIGQPVGAAGDFQGAARVRATGAVNSTTLFFPMAFNTPKRSTLPLILIYNPSSGALGAYNDSTAANVSSGASTRSNFQWTWRTNVTVTVNSLYSFHWTSDAEL